jgi:iron complex transport system permease protein
MSVNSGFFQPDAVAIADAADPDVQRRQRLAWTLLACVALGLAAGLATGMQGLSPAAFWADLHADDAALILGQIRAPRTLGAVLVGALLGLSGALAQGLFRNPLADPYLLGSASGAGLGVVPAPRWAAVPSAWPRWPGSSASAWSARPSSARWWESA